MHSVSSLYPSGEKTPRYKKAGTGNMGQKGKFWFSETGFHVHNTGNPAFSSPTPEASACLYFQNVTPTLLFEAKLIPIELLLFKFSLNFELKGHVTVIAYEVIKRTPKCLSHRPLP